MTDTDKCPECGKVVKDKEPHTLINLSHFMFGEGQVIKRFHDKCIGDRPHVEVRELHKEIVLEEPEEPDEEGPD